MRRGLDPSAPSSAPRPSVKGANEPAQQPSKCANDAPGSPSRREPVTQDLHASAQGSNEPQNETPPTSNSPAYLQGKNPYGRFLEKNSNPSTDSKFPTDGPPSQAGSSIVGRYRTSGSFQFVTRPAQAQPERQSAPLTSRSSLLPVKATKKFFEDKTSETQSGAPPLPPPGLVATGNVHTTVRRFQAQRPWSEPGGRSKSKEDPPVRNPSPTDEHESLRRLSDPRLPIPRPTSAASERVDRSQRESPFGRRKTGQVGPETATETATVPLDEAPVDQQQSQPQRKTTNAFEEPLQEPEPQSSIPDWRGIHHRRRLAELSSEAHSVIDELANVVQAMVKEATADPQPEESVRGTSQKTSRDKPQQASKSSGGPAEVPYSTGVHARKYGQSTGGDGTPTTSFSHDGSGSHQSFLRPYSADAEDEYEDFQIPDDMDWRSGYGRRNTHDFGYPGARIKPAGPYVSRTPLRNPGNWIRRACGHFSTVGNSESREEASKLPCSQCLAQSAANSTTTTKHTSARKRAATDSSTTSASTTRKYRSPRRRHHHSDCIPADWCGDTFAEDLGLIIDDILDEHRNTLQHVITNINSSQPRLARLHRLSQDLVHRSQESGAHSKHRLSTCESHPLASHEHARAHFCQPVIQTVYQPGCQHMALSCPYVPPKLAEKLNVGKSGQIHPNMNDPHSPLRKSTKSVPDLIRLVNSVADDFGIDLANGPSARDDDRFTKAPTEGQQTVSSLPPKSFEGKTTKQEPPAEESWLNKTRRQLSELSEARGQMMDELNNIAEDIGVRIQERRLSDKELDSIRKVFDRVCTGLSGNSTRPQNKSVDTITDEIPNVREQEIRERRRIHVLNVIRSQSKRVVAVSQGLDRIDSMPPDEVEHWLDLAQDELFAALNSISAVLQILPEPGYVSEYQTDDDLEYIEYESAGEREPGYGDFAAESPHQLGQRYTEHINELQHVIADILRHIPALESTQASAGGEDISQSKRAEAGHVEYTESIESYSSWESDLDSEEPGVAKVQYIPTQRRSSTISPNANSQLALAYSYDLPQNIAEDEIEPEVHSRKSTRRRTSLAPERSRSPPPRPAIRRVSTRESTIVQSQQLTVREMEIEPILTPPVVTPEKLVFGLPVTSMRRATRQATLPQIPIEVQPFGTPVGEGPVEQQHGFEPPVSRVRRASTQAPASSPDLDAVEAESEQPLITRLLTRQPQKEDEVKVFDLPETTPPIFKGRAGPQIPLSKAVTEALSTFSPGRPVPVVKEGITEEYFSKAPLGSDEQSPEPILQKSTTRRTSEQIPTPESFPNIPIQRHTGRSQSVVQRASIQKPTERTPSPEPVTRRVTTQKPTEQQRQTSLSRARTVKTLDPEPVARRVTTRKHTERISSAESPVPPSFISTDSLPLEESPAVVSRKPTAKEKLSDRDQPFPEATETQDARFQRAYTGSIPNAQIDIHEDFAQEESSLADHALEPQYSRSATLFQQDTMRRALVQPDMIPAPDSASVSSPDLSPISEEPPLAVEKFEASVAARSGPSLSRPPTVTSIPMALKSEPKIISRAATQQPTELDLGEVTYPISRQPTRRRTESEQGAILDRHSTISERLATRVPIIPDDRPLEQLTPSSRKPSRNPTEGFEESRALTATSPSSPTPETPRRGSVLTHASRKPTVVEKRAAFAVEGYTPEELSPSEPDVEPVISRVLARQWTLPSEVGQIPIGRSTSRQPTRRDREPSTVDEGSPSKSPAYVSNDPPGVEQPPCESSISASQRNPSGEYTARRVTEYIPAANESRRQSTLPIEVPTESTPNAAESIEIGSDGSSISAYSRSVFEPIIRRTTTIDVSRDVESPRRSSTSKSAIKSLEPVKRAGTTVSRHPRRRNKEKWEEYHWSGPTISSTRKASTHRPSRWSTEAVADETVANKNELEKVEIIADLHQQRSTASRKPTVISRQPTDASPISRAPTHISWRQPTAPPEIVSRQPMARADSPQLLNLNTEEDSLRSNVLDEPLASLDVYNASPLAEYTLKYTPSRDEDPLLPLNHIPTLRERRMSKAESDDEAVASQGILDPVITAQDAPVKRTGRRARMSKAGISPEPEETGRRARASTAGLSREPTSLAPPEPEMPVKPTIATRKTSKVRESDMENSQHKSEEQLPAPAHPVRDIPAWTGPLVPSEPSKPVAKPKEKKHFFVWGGKSKEEHHYEPLPLSPVHHPEHFKDRLRIGPFRPAAPVSAPESASGGTQQRPRKYRPTPGYELDDSVPREKSHYPRAGPVFERKDEHHPRHAPPPAHAPAYREHTPRSVPASVRRVVYSRPPPPPVPARGDDQSRVHSHPTPVRRDNPSRAPPSVPVQRDDHFPPPRPQPGPVRRDSISPRPPFQPVSIRRDEPPRWRMEYPEGEGYYPRNAPIFSKRQNNILLGQTLAQVRRELSSPSLRRERSSPSPQPATYLQSRQPQRDGYARSEYASPSSVRSRYRQEYTNSDQTRPRSVRSLPAEYIRYQPEEQQAFRDQSRKSSRLPAPNPVRRSQDDQESTRSRQVPQEVSSSSRGEGSRPRRGEGSHRKSGIPTAKQHQGSRGTSNGQKRGLPQASGSRRRLSTRQGGTGTANGTKGKEKKERGPSTRQGETGTANGTKGQEGREEVLLAEDSGLELQDQGEGRPRYGDGANGESDGQCVDISRPLSGRASASEEAQRLRGGSAVATPRCAGCKLRGGETCARTQKGPRTSEASKGTAKISGAPNTAHGAQSNAQPSRASPDSSHDSSASTRPNTRRTTSLGRKVCESAERPKSLRRKSTASELASFFQQDSKLKSPVLDEAAPAARRQTSFLWRSGEKGSKVTPVAEQRAKRPSLNSKGDGSSKSSMGESDAQGSAGNQPGKVKAAIAQSGSGLKGIWGWGWGKG